MDWKKYCQSAHTNQINAVPIKISMTFLNRSCKNNPKIYVKLQKTPNSKSILEQGQSWR